MQVSSLDSTFGSRLGLAEDRELASRSALCQSVEIRDEGADRSINPRNLWVSGIDQIVLVRSMCPGPVSHSKMSGGKIERSGSENVSRPGAGGSGPQYGIQTQLAVGRNLRLDELRILRGLCRIVAATHIDLYIAEAVFGKMLLQKRQCTGSRHVRHQPYVNLRDGTMRQNGLATGTRVSTDQALDVDRGLGFEQHERVKPVCVVDPMLNDEL